MKHPIIIATDELLSEMDALQIRGGVGEVQGLNVWKCEVNEQECVVYVNSCPSKTSNCTKTDGCPYPVKDGNCLNPKKYVGCGKLI